MNYKEQEEYEKKCDEKIACYKLYLPNEDSYWEITKTEHDHFKSMQLAEDINTEKNDLSNKIETGIATEKEIEEDMNKEVEAINYYLNK